MPAGSSDPSIILSNFSFASWIDSINNDPSTALTPKQVLEHFNAGVSNPLSKRQEFANCRQIGDQPARAGDAVACINELAARGGAGQICDVNSVSRTQCSNGGAQIVTVKGRPDNGPNSVNCNEIAKAGGVIMDRCFRVDQTVTGQAILAEGGIAVHIQQPLL